MPLVPGASHAQGFAYDSASGERVLRLDFLAVAGGGAKSSSDFTISETFSANLFMGDLVLEPSLL